MCVLGRGCYSPLCHWRVSVSSPLNRCANEDREKKTAMTLKWWTQYNWSVLLIWQFSQLIELISAVLVLLSRWDIFFLLLLLLLRWAPMYIFFCHYQSQLTNPPHWLTPARVSLVWCVPWGRHQQIQMCVRVSLVRPLVSSVRDTTPSDVRI